MSGRLVLAVLFALLLAVPAAAQEGPTLAASSAGHVAVQVPGGVRFADPDGRFGSTEPTEGEIFAIGRRGDAVAVWSDREGDRLLAAYRPPDGPFEPPTVLDRQPVTGEGSPVAGIDAAGTVVVAWAHGERVSLVAAIRDPATGWRPAQPLGGRDVFRPKLVVSDGGVATLAWRQNWATNRAEIATATRRPGEPTFDAPVVVSPRADDPGGGPELAANARGDAAVAWVVSRNRGRGAATLEFRVNGTFRRAGGPFVPRRRLTPGEGVFPSLAVRPDGGTVIAWADNGASASVRLRTPAGALRPQIRLTRNHELNTDPVAIARGAGAVAWLHREPPRSMLRVSAFAPDGRLGRPQTILRIRDALSLFEPSTFLDLPRGLFFVRGVSRDAARPLRLVRVD